MNDKQSDFDAVGCAASLMALRSGALATSAEGHPFASLVTLASDEDGSPLLLLSRLSAHTRHLQADPRASLLLCERGKGDPLAHPRLTLIGRAAFLPRDAVRSSLSLRERFLAAHPKAKLYIDFPDFSFWRLEIERAHLNGGFARAASMTGQEVLSGFSMPL